jgi:uncharacterized repeat protein (TIGR01451 family)
MSGSVRFRRIAAWLLMIAAAIGFDTHTPLRPARASASSGSYQLIDLSGATSVSAWDINDNGAVVGSWVVGGTNYAVKWDAPGGVVSATNIVGSGVALFINNNSQVVGEYGNVLGFFFDGVSRTDINPFPGDLQVVPTGLNVSGQVIGSSSGISTPRHGFIFAAGATTWLGDGVIPTAINDGGTVIGYSESLGSSFIRQPNGTTTAFPSNARFINNNGDIAGTNGTRAFYYSAATGLHQIDPIAGYGSSYTWDGGGGGLTADGQVFGISFGGGNGYDHPFRWTLAGGTEELTLPAGAVGGDVYGVSDTGQAVGHLDTYDAGGQYHDSAFVYRGSGLEDLNTLIDPASGLRIVEANAINVKGQIAAIAIDSSRTRHAVLLNPQGLTPTTTTLTTSNNPSNAGQTISLTATVSPAAATGTVTFYDGTAVIGTATLTLGGAVLQISDLAAGTHSITAKYEGDTTFDTSTSSVLQQQVDPAVTTITVSGTPNPAALGQSVVLTASVNGFNPTGTVTFSEGGTSLGVVSLTNGVATVTISTFAVGTHTITVTYGGDANNTSASGSGTETVTAAVDLAVTKSANPGPAGVGQQLTYTIVVSNLSTNPATGVMLQDPLPNGVNFNTVNGPGTCAVQLPATVVCAIGNMPPGGQAIFTIIVTPAATGVFTNTAFVFGNEGDSQPANNTASVQTTVSTALAPIYAQGASYRVLPSLTDLPLAPVYAQGATYRISTTLAGQPLAPIYAQGVTYRISTTLAGQPLAPIYVQGVTYRIAVSTAEQALAPIYAQGATYRIDVLTAGQPLAPIYAQGASYQISNQPAATATILSSTPEPSALGEAVTLVASVGSSAGTPSGSVTFNDGLTPLGAVTLSGGMATLTTSTLTVGTHSLTAVYSGSTDFSSSTSAPVSQVVNPAATSTALGASPNLTAFSQPVTLTATVTSIGGTPTGAVTFVDGTLTLGTATLSGGAATLSVSTLAVGVHSITGSYSGSPDFMPSTSPAVMVAVNKASTTTSISSSRNPTVFGQTTTFGATVAAVPPGTATPTGAVTFRDVTAAKNLGTASLTGGTATLDVSNLATTSHTIVAMYKGSTSFSTSTSAPLTQVVTRAATALTVVSSKNPSRVGQSVTFTASVVAVSPSSGTPAGTVSFYDGATFIGVVTLKNNGKASLSTATLLPGSHSITATYSGSPDYQGAASSLTQKVN